MARKLIQTEKNEFARDTVSMALINTDKAAFAQYKAARQRGSAVEELEVAEADVNDQERTLLMEDLQLEDPVAKAPIAPVPPATGQVDASQFQALFPNDPTGTAIAQRGVRRG